MNRNGQSHEFRLDQVLYLLIRETLKTGCDIDMVYQPFIIE